MDLTKMSLAGKVALVTGGSRGIGRACALAFADAGADVVVTARKQPELDAVAKEISDKGRKVLTVSSHIAKTEEIKALVEKVKAEFGRVDVLMNNAGTNPFYGPLIKAEEWAFDATMNVNVKGPFLLSLLIAKMMREHGGGTIVNTASTAGMRASSLPIYSITKAALIMATEVMAKEWGQYNIRVNAIAPGIIKTKLSEALWKDAETGEKAAKSTSLGRLGEPEDVASVVLFLASDASRYVTGQTIAIDGGLMIGPASFPE